MTYQVVPFPGGELEVVGQGPTQVVTLTLRGLEVMIHTPTIEGSTGPMIEISTGAMHEDSCLRVLLDQEVLHRREAGHHQASFRELTHGLFLDPFEPKKG